MAVCCVLISTSFSQQISRSELKSNEWFSDNSDTIFDLLDIKLAIGESLILVARPIPTTYNDSLFGAQEYPYLKHYNFSNFVFRPNGHLTYYISEELSHYSLFIGTLPNKYWKLKRRNKLILFIGEKRLMTLTFKEKRKLIGKDNDYIVNTLTFVRSK